MLILTFCNTKQQLEDERARTLESEFIKLNVVVH